MQFLLFTLTVAAAGANLADFFLGKSGNRAIKLILADLYVFLQENNWHGLVTTPSRIVIAALMPLRPNMPAIVAVAFALTRALFASALLNITMLIVVVASNISYVLYVTHAYHDRCRKAISFSFDIYAQIAGTVPLLFLQSWFVDAIAWSIILVIFRRVSVSYGPKAFWYLLATLPLGLFVAVVAAAIYTPLPEILNSMTLLEFARSLGLHGLRTLDPRLWEWVTLDALDRVMHGDFQSSSIIIQKFSCITDYRSHTITTSWQTHFGPLNTIFRAEAVCPLIIMWTATAAGALILWSRRLTMPLAIRLLEAVDDSPKGSFTLLAIVLGTIMAVADTLAKL